MVKRQKSDANLNGSAVAVVNGSARDGALIKSVCLLPRTRGSLTVIWRAKYTWKDVVG